MTLLGASILFNKGTNTHNQLRYICSHPYRDETDIINVYNTDTEFDELLQSMDELCGLGNTRNNREQLQSFLLRYSDKIYLEFNRCNLLAARRAEQRADVYDLK